MFKQFEHAWAFELAGNYSPGCIDRDSRFNVKFFGQFPGRFFCGIFVEGRQRCKTISQHGKPCFQVRMFEEVFGECFRVNFKIVTEVGPAK